MNIKLLVFYIIFSYKTNEFSDLKEYKYYFFFHKFNSVLEIFNKNCLYN